VTRCVWSRHRGDDGTGGRGRRTRPAHRTAACASMVMRVTAAAVAVAASRARVAASPSERARALVATQTSLPVRPQAERAAQRGQGHRAGPLLAHHGRRQRGAAAHRHGGAAVRPAGTTQSRLYRNMGQCTCHPFVNCSTRVAASAVHRASAVRLRRRSGARGSAGAPSQARASAARAAAD
jgi:hypothetical protein